MPGWTSGSPVANVGDTPYSMPGLLGELQSAATPIVVARSVPTPGTSTTVRMVYGRDALVYGAIVTDSLRSDNVLGDPLSGELMRVGTVRVEELT